MRFVILGVYRFSKNRKLPFRKFNIASASSSTSSKHKSPLCCESSRVSSALLFTWQAALPLEQPGSPAGSPQHLEEDMLISDYLLASRTPKGYSSQHNPPLAWPAASRVGPGLWTRALTSKSPPNLCPCLATWASVPSPYDEVGGGARVITWAHLRLQGFSNGTCQDEPITQD